MAVILNALGETGVSRFGILIGFLIPIINVLAVSTLIWYSGQTIDMRQRLRITLRALISNPLIIGCLAGMAYSRMSVHSRFSGQHLPPGRHGGPAPGPALHRRHLDPEKYQGPPGHAFLGSAIKLLMLPTVGWFFLKVR
jgi:hypothetical protein